MNPVQVEDIRGMNRIMLLGWINRVETDRDRLRNALRESADTLQTAAEWLEGDEATLPIPKGWLADQVRTALLRAQEALADGAK